MESEKLSNMLQLISERFTFEEIPFCLIGAMALGIYGLPRYTSDIDLMALESDWPKLSIIMEELGYKCFQKTDMPLNTP
jgi:hypothetical protein